MPMYILRVCQIKLNIELASQKMCDLSGSPMGEANVEEHVLKMTRN